MSAPDPSLDLPHDVRFDDRWQASAVRSVVDSRCQLGRAPSHLFLGTREAELLLEHLGDAFGEDAVSNFDDLYYMGMRVVELDTPSCVRIAGETFMDRLQRDGIDLASWSEEQLSRWRVHFDEPPPSPTRSPPGGACE